MASDSRIPIRRSSSLQSSRSLPPARKSGTDAKVKWGTLDGGKLEQLFPSFSINARRSVSLSGGMQRVERVFFTPADQIAKRAFDKEEIEKVKTLALHRLEIADDQIEALVTRFDQIETVILDEVFQVTEAALSAFRTLKKLKTVQIKSCPNIKKLDSLPLEQLAKIQTALPYPVGVDAAKRLAASPALSSVDLGNLSPLQKEELLCFRAAHEAHPINIQVHGSAHITPELVARLNQGRRVPICVEGVPIVPDRPNPRRIPPLSAAELTVPIKTTSRELIGLVIRHQSLVSAASVCGCEEIDYEGIIYLNELQLLKKLYLGKLPKATVRSIEVMLAPRLQRPIWTSLEEVRFYNALLSDRALDLLSRLQSLHTIHLIDCTSFSLQGVQNFFTKTRLLKKLVIAGCPAVDPLAVLELKVQRSYVRLQAEDLPDPTAIAIAEKEANDKIKEGKSRYHLLAKFLGKDEPIDEKAQFSGDTRAITRYYAERLDALKIDASKISADHWILADLFLQSFMNLRAAWAIRSELFRVGEFQNIDLDSPRNLQEIMIHLADSEKERANVRVFRFEGLGMTALPQFIQDLDWPKLERVEGVAVPPDFKKKCPRLQLPK